MKDKKLFLPVITLFLVFFVTTAYGAFRILIVGNINATTDNWSFVANIPNSTLNNNVFNLPLSGSVIAPGDSGSFTVTLNGSGSNYDIKYNMIISGSTIPTNMDFCLDSACNTIINKSSGLDNIIIVRSEAEKNVTIYWKWTANKYASDDANFTSIPIALISIKAVKAPSTYVLGENVTLVSDGDGLYRDELLDGRYIYKGANPNNYIIFNGTYTGGVYNAGSGVVYRILSVEKDGTVRIVHNTSDSTLVWHSTSSSLNYNNSSVRTYLNGSFYNSINTTNKNFIVLKKSYIGQVNYYKSNDSSKTIRDTVTAEKTELETNSSYASLMEVSDYLRASSNPSCNLNTTWLQIGTKVSGSFPCDINNYLLYSPSTDSQMWFINKYSDTRVRRWLAPTHSDNAGSIQFASSTESKMIRPVISINSNVVIVDGSGTADDPYIMGETLDFSPVTCTITGSSEYELSKILTVNVELNGSSLSSTPYFWTGDAGFGNSNTKTVSAAGTYEVTILDSNNKRNTCRATVVSQTEYSYRTRTFSGYTAWSKAGETILATSDCSASTGTYVKYVCSDYGCGGSTCVDICGDAMCSYRTKYTRSATYSSWSGWSEWQTSSVTSSSTVDVKTRLKYAVQ